MTKRQMTRHQKQHVGKRGRRCLNRDKEGWRDTLGKRSSLAVGCLKQLIYFLSVILCDLSTMDGGR